jgi:hypothetical protein
MCAMVPLTLRRPLILASLLLVLVVLTMVIGNGALFYWWMAGHPTQSHRIYHTRAVVWSTVFALALVADLVLLYALLQSVINRTP